jgi:hypothetical protein
MNLDPRAPSNNLHHTATYRSEADWLEDEFGKGPYDPDSLVGAVWRTVPIDDKPLNMEDVPF